jgi:hypothetical protein
MIQRTGEVVIRMLADVKQKTIGPLINGGLPESWWNVCSEGRRRRVPRKT